MNLLLLNQSELDAGNEVVLEGERAKHLRRILKVQPGDQVRVGLVDGNVGFGTVVAIEGFAVRLLCECDQAPPAKGEDTLLLAFARPKVLLRCLEHATALGFGKIVLFRSKRVEKSHLSSSAMNPEVMNRHVVHGLVQARRTLRPELTFLPNFKDLLEANFDTLVSRENRFLADPDVPEEAALAQISNGPLSVAIGPEGGFVPFELEALRDNGFQLVKAGSQPLRVETAVAYLTGQLRAARSIQGLDQ